VKTWLIDTGPLVAFLDAADPGHKRVVACLEDFSGQLVTTSAVITEAMHFVSASKDGARLLAEFVTLSRTEVYDLCRPPELLEAAMLMQKYADTPMDFADATLLLLAEALDVRDIITLDRRGFSAYRTRRRRGLRLVLDTVANRKN
jgi:predicted nucleic acid-binding protein